jgi:hypothetical protein
LGKNRGHQEQSKLIHDVSSSLRRSDITIVRIKYISEKSFVSSLAISPDFYTIGLFTTNNDWRVVTLSSKELFSSVLGLIIVVIDSISPEA